MTAATSRNSACDRLAVVVADTGPINYLVLIDRALVLASLFGGVLIPEAVRGELTHAGAPDPVRAWISHPPLWLSIRPDGSGADPVLPRLGPGEREAIRLALAVPADLLVMDDRSGVAAARARGLTVTGLLGLLDLAAQRGLIDIAEAIARLRNTSFRCRPDLMTDLVSRHRPASGSGA